MKTQSRRRVKKSLREKLDAQLALLENVQLVRHTAEEEPAYIFKNVLTQEAAYESLLHQHRREIHRLVAETYERFYADRPDEFAALLARHYAEAGNAAKALDYSIRAGDAAARVYAHEEAIEHFTRALKTADHCMVSTEQLVHIYERRGRAYELAGQYDHALDNYAEMAKWAKARGDRALELESLMLRATVYSVGGRLIDSDKAQTLSLEGLALARELNDRKAEARIFWNLMLLNRFRYDGARKAVEYGEKSIAIARELDLREQLALSLNDVGTAYILIGQLERALAVKSEAATLWRELGNIPMLAESLASQALPHVVRGELEQARRVAEEAYLLDQSISNWFGLSTSAGFLALAYRELGEMDRCLALLEEARRAVAQIGFIVLAWLQQVELAATLIHLGAFERGLEHARQTLIQSDQVPTPVLRGVSAALIALAHLRRGDQDAAEIALKDFPLRSVEEYSSALAAPSGVEATMLAHVELAMTRKDYARADQIADEFCVALRRMDARLLLSSALAVRARALAAQNRLDDARALLLEARRLCEVMQARNRLWPILAQLTEIERRCGETTEAQASRAQAAEVIEFIANHTPPELREEFLNSPNVCAIRDVK